MNRYDKLKVKTDELLSLRDVEVSTCGCTVRGVKDLFTGYIQIDTNNDSGVSSELWKAYHKELGYLAGFDTAFDAFRALQLADDLYKQLNNGIK